MQLSNNSKKLIIAIMAMTGLGVLLTSPNPTEPAHESIATASDQSIYQANMLDPTTIKSLTNLTQHIIIDTVGMPLRYRGYIQGVGYSSYQFLGEKGQKIIFSLEAPSNMEMILYGTTIVPISNNMEYTLPENGSYDLRILYKPSIELQQTKKSSDPEAYYITFTLQASPTTPLVEQP
ncbi:hypothetical protein F9B74_02655 [Pelistega sp. NLN82]|uniref:Uncharacterized protein n=1 Tax=Pelistega ratti TaxID=2652177 RepID=A0A6L9Y469_9BURK|nr:hypothetical protein [Pelistega ratti]NEN75229.1 hypothetical protein [Pelistega ratti]